MCFPPLSIFKCLKKLNFSTYFKTGIFTSKIQISGFSQKKFQDQDTLEPLSHRVILGLSSWRAGALARLIIYTDVLCPTKWSLGSQDSVHCGSTYSTGIRKHHKPAFRLSSFPFSSSFLLSSPVSLPLTFSHVFVCLDFLLCHSTGIPVDWSCGQSALFRNALSWGPSLFL